MKHIFLFLAFVSLFSHFSIAQHPLYHSDTVYSNRIDKAKALYDNGKYQEAVISFTTILKDYPDDMLAYLLRGNSKMQLKKYKEAKSDFLLSIALKPLNPQTHFSAGEACFFLSEYTEAIHHFDDAIEIEPDKGIYYYYRGVAKGASGDEDGGCKDLYRALDNGYSDAQKSINQLCNTYKPE
jgi:tetratricopeptide (TPR) repeat protein